MIKIVLLDKSAKWPAHSYPLHPDTRPLLIDWLRRACPKPTFRTRGCRLFELDVSNTRVTVLVYGPQYHARSFEKVG